MIVLECIEFYLNGYVGWIIIMELKVLLNTQYLIRKILVDEVLDVHVRGVKIKRFLDLDVVTMHFL
jgi:hypothetical protein